MLTFMAGATITGAVVARYNVLRKSSLIPRLNLARMSAVAGATRYDALRGDLASFPVGPGGGDEFCFNDLAGPSVTDATVPAPGTGFWYLSRGENACGNGSYGTQSNLTPRISTTCP